ncbi:MAG TPA: ABC transporter permease [Candidatus Limnocylindrales bacterium]
MLALAFRFADRSPVAAYLRLEIRRQLRNRRFVIFTIAFPVILYVLYTAVLETDTNGPVAGLAWPVYFLVSMASYGAIGAAMSQANPIAAERASGWTRQLRVTPLPGSAYVTGKLLSAVLLTLPALVLVSVAGASVNHVDLRPAAWVELVVGLALSSVPFAALGILLGYLFDTDSAQGAMVLTFFGMAILGGLFAPIEAFPDPLATIARVLPSYHLAAIGRAIAADRLPDLVDVIVLTAYAVVLGGLAGWRYLRADARAHG